ncbi:YfiT family bacillithiol transferase [Flaviaesturariibacter amylovorans]|uniref:Bacillithiol transferase BstA n=1 Tax=Flaviaesturariibacter amylovorans TaxID=1084520 RepID=A0ABP8GV16_9BACT
METAIDLRYPIGKYSTKEFSRDQREQWMADIRFLPNLLEQSLQNLDEAQLHTPYREGGWTVHQLVHHIADSHMNAYMRFKLGMTEENPTIKPYEENDWAHLADVAALPVNTSVTLLFALHTRWDHFLRSLSDEVLQQRTVFHPEHQQQMTLWYLLGMYAWHSRHHVAHINALRERMGW